MSVAAAAGARLVIDFEGTTAGFRNSLGWYLIDSKTGEIGKGGLVFSDARAVKPGTRYEIDVPEGSRIGTFLIANGAGQNRLDALAPGEWRFVDVDGGPATLDSAAPRLMHVGAEGGVTAIRGDIWHSAGFGETVGLNSDRAAHVRGMAEKDGAARFGWEDLRAGRWDGDFTDVVMTVRLEGAGLEFVNPDVKVATPAVVPCFAAGTLIATAQGPRPVERLCAGDAVCTRDNGLQRLLWVGQRPLGRAVLRARPEFRPIRIGAGALGPDRPLRDLLVSAQHRVLVATPWAELLFGAPEVLVAARHLLGLPGIRQGGTAPVRYVHLLCDRHEILRAEGVWTESFQPGELSQAGFDAPQRAELAALFPDATPPLRAARTSLRAHEAAALLATLPGAAPPGNATATRWTDPRPSPIPRAWLPAAIPTRS